MKTHVSKRKFQWEGYLFAAPWLIGFIVFTAGSMAFSVWMSLQKWNITTPPVWVGFRNYEKAFTQDALFWKCLFNTAYYAFVSVPLRVMLALLLAVLLNQPVRGIAFFQT